MLMPKRTKYRKQQRGSMKGAAHRGNKIAYGEYGLVRIDKNGGMTYFTDENSDVSGSRFRVTEELNDGRILAVSLPGISIIDGDRVDAAICAEDGIDGGEGIGGTGIGGILGRRGRSGWIPESG